MTGDDGGQNAYAQTNTERLLVIAADTDAIRQHLGLGPGEGTSAGTNTERLLVIAADTDAIRQHLGLGPGEGTSAGTNTERLLVIAADTDAIRQHLGLGPGEGTSAGTNTERLLVIAADTDAIRQHYVTGVPDAGEPTPPSGPPLTIASMSSNDQSNTSMSDIMSKVRNIQARLYDLEEIFNSIYATYRYAEPSFLDDVQSIAANLSDMESDIDEIEDILADVSLSDNTVRTIIMILSDVESDIDEIDDARYDGIIYSNIALFVENSVTWVEQMLEGITTIRQALSAFDNNTAPRQTFPVPPPVIDPENAPPAVNGTSTENAPPAVNGTQYNATNFSIQLKDGETLTGNVVLGDLGMGVPINIDLFAFERALPSGNLSSMTLAPARLVSNASVSIELSSTLIGDAPLPTFKPSLFFDVNVLGDNFTDPSSFSEYGLPRIKFTVPTDIDIDERFADGCPITSVYLLENGQWGQIGHPQVGPNQIYVANASGNSVSIVDITGNQTPEKINVGAMPRDIALNGQTGLLYVSSFDSGNVTVIDTAGEHVAATIDVGDRPIRILVDESKNSIYAVQAGGNITIINGSTNAVARTIAFSGLFSNGTAFDFENMIGYVGDLSKNAILVLDLETGAIVDEITVNGGPAAIDIDYASNIVYSSTSSSGKVVVINATTNTVIDTIAVGGSPAGLVFNPNNNRVYVGNALSDTVSVIDAHTRALIRNIPVGNASYGIDLIKSTNTLYVTHQKSGNVTIIDGSTDAVAGTIKVGTGAQAIEANPAVSNPLRNPAADTIHNGTILDCSYTGGLPHLSKFAIGGIKPASKPATAGSDDTMAPTFDFITSEDDYNLDINGNLFKLDSFGTADTQKFRVGDRITMSFTVMEQGGADDLVHFEFLTNLTGPVRDYEYSDTRLEYDRGAEIQVDDPNEYFTDASLTVSDSGDDLVRITVELAFAKPMTPSDVILKMWDEHGHSLTTIIPDMVEITE